MLTLIVFIPLIAALALLFVNKDNAGTVRSISVGAVGVTFLVSLVLVSRFDSLCRICSLPKPLPGFLCSISTIR